MFIEKLLDKADQIKDSKGKSQGAKNRSIVAGVITGGLIGLMLGYSKKWNLFYSCLTGAVIGGGAGAVFVPKN